MAEGPGGGRVPSPGPRPSRGVGLALGPEEFVPLPGLRGVAEVPGAPTLLAVLGGGALRRVRFPAGEVEELGSVTCRGLELQQDLVLAASPGGRFLAFAEVHGSRGLLLDLERGRIPRVLDRGDYHNQHCVFSLAFAAPRGRLVLVYADDWNLLHACDPATGRCLTPRLFRREGPSSSQFCGRLHVSPDGEYLCDDGWVWHPVGIPRVWSLVRWLERDPYEPEAGESLRPLAQRDDWDIGVAWLGPRALATWGGELGAEDFDGAVVYDAVSGQELRRLPGPRGRFGYDGWLWSYLGDEVRAWDVRDGAQVYAARGTRVDGYLPGLRAFYALADEGLRLYRVTGPRGPEAAPAEA